MAETEAKFGSLAWFKAWGERLIQAGIDGVTNELNPKTVSAGEPTVKPGSVMRQAVSWLPYALIAGAALILVLVLKKR